MGPKTFKFPSILGTKSVEHDTTYLEQESSPIPGTRTFPSSQRVPMEKRYGVSVYKEKFNFCSAHFLLFPDGKREELHGHNYRVWVDVDAPMGAGDVVIDFMLLKPIVKELCDALDHRTLLPSMNAHLTIEEKDGMVWAYHGDDKFAFPKRDVIILNLPNTSTERLAEYFCGGLRTNLESQLTDLEINRIRVSVEETSGQCGYYEERNR